MLALATQRGGVSDDEEINDAWVGGAVSKYCSGHVVDAAAGGPVRPYVKKNAGDPSYAVGGGGGGGGGACDHTTEGTANAATTAAAPNRSFAAPGIRDGL